MVHDTTNLHSFHWYSYIYTDVPRPSDLSVCVNVRLARLRNPSS